MATRKINKPAMPEFTPPPPKKYRCVKCAKERIADGRDKIFYMTKNPMFIGNDGFMHLCRDCQRDLFLEYYDETGNLSDAVEILCQRFNLFFDPTAVGKLTKTTGPENIWSNYMRALNGATYRFKTYDDYRREKNKQTINNNEQLEEARENGLLVPSKAVDFFGAGFTPQDLQFLVTDYNDWITRHECNTKAQEEVFKDLAIANLKKRQAAVKNDQKAYESAVNTFQKTLDAANLQPKQTKGVDTTITEANTLGTLIEKWEDNDPIPDTDPEFEDVDGIKRYVTVWFFGHLCKMLGIKNDAAAEYEKEKAKYDVTHPDEVEDDEEESEEIRDILKAAMDKGGG